MEAQLCISINYPQCSRAEPSMCSFGADFRTNGHKATNTKHHQRDDKRTFINQQLRHAVTCKGQRLHRARGLALPLQTPRRQQPPQRAAKRRRYLRVRRNDRHRCAVAPERPVDTLPRVNTGLCAGLRCC